MRKLIHSINCWSEKEFEDFLESVKEAFFRQTLINFLRRELKADRIVELSYLFNLSCGILVYRVLKSYVDTELVLLFLLQL